MINYRQIVEFIYKGINQNEKIAKYCEDTYKKGIKIYVGADTQNPPTAENMPLLLIEPLQKNIGSSEESFTYEMLLKVAISGFKKPDIKDNVVIYDGIFEVEELGNLIAEDIRLQIGEKSNLDTFDVNFYHDEINSFPIYTGTIIFGFNVPNVIGCEKLNFKGE